MLITFLVKVLVIQNKALFLIDSVRCIISNENMNINQTIGEVLQETRERKGLLLRQVSALLDTAILIKVERGERKTTKEQIIKLAGILDLDREELLIHYLSEKLAYELVDEDVASQTLKVVEEKVEYLKFKNDKF